MKGNSTKQLGQLTYLFTYKFVTLIPLSRSPVEDIKFVCIAFASFSALEPFAIICVSIPFAVLSEKELLCMLMNHSDLKLFD